MYRGIVKYSLISLGLVLYSCITSKVISYENIERHKAIKKKFDKKKSINGGINY